MAAERDSLTPKERHQISDIPLIALEGVGGSGKSHVGEILNKTFEKHGFQVFTAKVSGLGDSERVKRLRDINDCREELLRGGTASEKVIEDKRKDKIFRLATRYQTRLLVAELKGTSANIGILDRTPIMPWVYASAFDPNNPYLEEILKDGIEQTSSLGISIIYYLQVTPETAYSRIIARTCVFDTNPEQRVREFCNQIGASPDSTQQVISRISRFISSNPGMKSKDYRRWDFIPYEVMAKECERYMEVLDILRLKYGIKYLAIDAERPIDQVVGSILEDVKANNLLQNI